MSRESLFASLLRDVDTALTNYGVAFTTTEMPDALRAEAFETARRALRQARERIQRAVVAEDKP